MLEKFGLLDEGLYTYCDDTDICLRAKRAGWETWFVPQRRVIQYMGASTGVRVEGKKSRLPAYWLQARRRYFLNRPRVLSLRREMILTGCQRLQRII
jgi:N-acetylglucosaminyl-diphospho-decaprenol L-rhamnosyltransferase